MSNDFKISHKGMAQILLGPEMIELSEHFAKEGMAFAKAISPESKASTRRRYGKSDESSRYKDNFVIRGPFVRNLTSEFPSRRQCVELANTSRYAEAVEQGWQQGIGRQPNHSGYHVFAQTHAFLNTPIEGP